MPSTSPAIYTPTDDSARATRRSMGAAGMASLLSSRAKPRADERAKTSARAWGWEGGRFVG
jgi:hypothetical protein